MRIAVVDNTRFRSMQEKYEALATCNRSGISCAYMEGDQLRIDEAACAGPLATICAKAAPHAIKVVKLPEQLDKQPVHRYGKNGFSLFDLPTPVPGKVLGIVGVNGIGKTTALRLIAGDMKANLGMQEKATYEELSQHFKGKELQLFFSKMAKGSIISSLKPQHVDLIPRHFAGTARELLENVDDQGNLRGYAESLGMGRILDNEISTLSGGELQRLAILAASLKKADLYIFDEPSSYLDIKQRLIVSRFIRSLVDDKTSIVVVEHDLVVLDYMSDDVCVMFGVPGAYGSVSSRKPVRKGINQFIDGYLKEENIRFRDHHIRFGQKQPFISPDKDVFSWQDMLIRKESFAFSTPGGSIGSEVLGIIGENGTGKTTFAIALSGSTGVSYKPQFIEPAEEIVASSLSDADPRLLEDLGMIPLMDRKLSGLSGGELQRVAIVRAMSKDAGLYILDEPSAYLDVEQRIIAARVIRDHIAQKEVPCMVIDHDLVFIDYVSDRLLVFSQTLEGGTASGLLGMEEGMNKLLSELGITIRRDEDSERPRINKPESVKDREQRSRGRYYY